MAEDKGFKPSDKKIKEARKKGQVLKSPLCSQTASIIGAVLGLLVSLSLQHETLLGLVNWTIRSGYNNVLIASHAWVQLLLILLLVPVGTASIFAILSEFFQVRFEVHTEMLGPDISRLSPAKGLQKIGQGLLSTWLLSLKLITISFVGYVLIKKEFAILVYATTSSKQTALSLSYSSFLTITSTLLCIMLCFSAIEYFFKRRKFYRELSMSIDDLRREHKEDEGDPHQKGHRKHLHQSLMSQEITKRVRKSKVIIVEKKKNI